MQLNETAWSRRVANAWVRKMEKSATLTSCVPLKTAESKSLECGRSLRCDSLGDGFEDDDDGWRMLEDCWATCCICFCWCFCCFFNSFLSSKIFSFEPTLSKSFNLSLDDCFWFFANFLVAPRSAEALPALTAATRSKLDVEADVFNPTECEGDIGWDCLGGAAGTFEGLPPWPLRNSDFNFIILVSLDSLSHKKKLSFSQILFQFQILFLIPVASIWFNHVVFWLKKFSF